MNKAILTFCYIALLFFSSVFGATKIASVGEPQQCIRLGARPAFIIKFKNKISSFKLNNALDANFLRGLSTPEVKFTGSRILSRGAYLVFFNISRPATSSVQQIKPGCYDKNGINELMFYIKTRADIEFITPNRLFSLTSLNQINTREASISATQWNLMAPPRVNIDIAWDYTRGNSGYVVAVLDTGIFNNDSLNPNVLPGVHFTDDGSFGNGAEPSCSEEECKDANHGTHVGGIVAATGNLAYGERIYGVAPAIKIVPVNVFTKKTLQADCGDSPTPCLRTDDADLTNALNWVDGESFAEVRPVPAGLVDVNMSLGSDGDCVSSEGSVITKLRKRNILTVVAASNENKNAALITPGNCPGVINVAATNRRGFRAPYSNFGESVTLAAPGGDFLEGGDQGAIYSTVRNAYDYQQGTSQAAPHVAGVISLMLSVAPNLSSDEIVNILRDTVSPFSPTLDPEKSCRGRKSCGTGILDAGLAVQTAAQIAPPVFLRAIRNPMARTQAFVFYQRRGSFIPGVTNYTVNGSPGATMKLDQPNQRFIISGIQTPRAVTITVTETNASYFSQSNAVTIPAILK